MAGRLQPLVPLALLLTLVAVFAAWGDPVTTLVGRSAPPLDELSVRRVELRPREIRVRVTNPQQDAITVASVTVDDAIVPFHVDGSARLGRLRSSTIVVPYDWVADEPLAIGVTSSTGIETTAEVAAAVETPRASVSSAAGYALIGFFVGVVPVAIGLLWLRPLRRVSARWLSAFMALTAGLLTFLGVEALAEALDLQAALPAALGGPGLVLVGVAVSWLALAGVSQALGGRGRESGLRGVSLATLVAIGIGLHNLGEGLAIGTSFALGELALGTFLIIGFMVHNVTEGLGIAAPIADGARAVGLRVLVALALVAGGPAILGTWIGGYVTSDVATVLFFAIAAGAAFQVVGEVGRYVLRRAPGALRSPHVLGGFVAGLVVMYATGLLAG